MENKNYKNVQYSFKDGFADEMFYYCIFEPTNKEFIEIAKEKDGEDYNEKCFQIVINYNEITKQYTHGVYQYVTVYNGTLELGILTNDELLDVLEHIKFD